MAPPEQHPALSRDTSDPVKRSDVPVRTRRGMLRRHSLERRLFAWLLALALVPTALILTAVLSISAGSLEILGTLGPWTRVADSGRALIEAAEPAAARDAVLDSALRTHRRELSESLVQAQRWQFLGDRIAAVAPLLMASIGLILATLALLVSRRIAHEIARPVQELVDWADRMARGETLPAPLPGEVREVAEVRRLRGALRAAAEQIAEARTRALETERVRAWGELARRVAHEMKNPLTPLRLAAHRLRRSADGAAAVEAIGVIEEETARLDELAKSFAVLGRPSAGPASEVDLEELLAGLLETDVPAGLHTRLEVAAGTSAIHAHYDALQRAFRNLVRNAVEAVEAAGGGAITVAVGPAPGGGVVVTVADTGRGFPEDVAERLFEPDFTLKAGGTGLGLAIVHQAVAAHGGRVMARARAGGGAEFVVRLPPAPAAAVS
jgi:two-component system, NtrC family, nitrogen regulation sensor histidine kinase NtrY